MKILYDHQAFSLQEVGGISRTFLEFTTFLSKDIEAIHTTYLTNNKLVEEKNSFRHRHFLPNINFRGKNRIINTINKKASIQKIKKNDWDIIHPTYYDPYFIKYIPKKPVVIHLHDFIYERYPEYFPKNNTHTEQKRKCLERADKIIAITEKTKQDCIDILNINKPIDVIYSGITLETEKPIEPLCKRPYLLFVGERSGYKNFETVAKAFSILSKKQTDFLLICTGHPFTKKEKEFLANLDIIDKCSSKYYTNVELGQLYRNAEAFIFPSLYEGFGLPILEAFKYECPVILSNCSCFPEVASNAAAYFEAQDVDSLLYSINKVLSDRDNYIKLGSSRVENFSWKKTALNIENVYRSLF